MHMIEEVFRIIRLFLCDDDKACVRHLAQMIQTLEPQRFVTTQFCDADSLQQELQNAPCIPDCIFLDIELGENNGIDVANEIATHYPATFFVFVTMHEIKYAQRIFLKDVTPIGFLSKPVQLDILKQLLNKVATQVQARNQHCLSLKTRNQIFLLRFCDIMYLESQRHQVKAHTLQTVYVATAQLTEVETQLPPNFVRCHKSFIVNLDFMDGYSANSNVVLHHGTIQVPISRPYKAVFQKTAALYRGLQL